MNISWIFSDTLFLEPEVDLKIIKDVGSIWGSWRTWRAYQTDNVVCHDFQKADELIRRSLQTRCNFYVPNDHYLKLERPAGVMIYEGNFVHDVDHQEEIVAMHLAASVSDIVLLLGFEFGEPTTQSDKLQEHRAHNYRHLCKQAIKSNANTQWVLVDHNREIMKDWKDLGNLTKDSLSNVLTLINTME